VSWYLHAREVATPGLESRSGGLKGADFVQFYVMGSFVREGRTDALYDPVAHAREAQRTIAPAISAHAPAPNYAPAVAALFVPFSALSFPVALASFAVRWLWQSAPHLRPDGLLVGLFAAASPAFLFTLRYGQLSAWALLAISAGVVALAAGRRGIAGLAFGLLAFKPTLLGVLLPVVIVARDWRVAGGVLVSVLLQGAAGWLVAGPEGLTDYGQVLLRLAANPDLVVLFPETSHSLRGFVRLLGGSSLLAGGLTLLAWGGAVLAGSAAWRTAAAPLTRVAFIVLLTLITAPHVLTYDLLLLLPSLVALADWLLQSPPPARSRWAWSLVAGGYLAPFSPLLAPASHIQLSTIVMAVTAVASWRAMQADAALTASTPAPPSPSSAGPP
jgi:hypothetical protein